MVTTLKELNALTPAEQESEILSKLNNFGPVTYTVADADYLGVFLRGNDYGTYSRNNFGTLRCVLVKEHDTKTVDISVCSGVATKEVVDKLRTLYPDFPNQFYDYLEEQGKVIPFQQKRLATLALMYAKVILLGERAINVTKSRSSRSDEARYTGALRDLEPNKSLKLKFHAPCLTDLALIQDLFPVSTGTPYCKFKTEDFRIQWGNVMREGYLALESCLKPELFKEHVIDSENASRPYFTRFFTDEFGMWTTLRDAEYKYVTYHAFFLREFFKMPFSFTVEREREAELFSMLEWLVHDLVIWKDYTLFQETDFAGEVVGLSYSPYDWVKNWIGNYNRTNDTKFSVANVYSRTITNGIAFGIMGEHTTVIVLK